jgi:6,7-dimethyl-8-ribityllumazine synthase
MSSNGNNLSLVKGSAVKTNKASDYVIGIVWSEWNTEITSALKDAALNTLLEHGVLRKNIIIKSVPGAFELTLGAQWLVEETKVEAVICIGCVIQGETKHFDFICNSVAQGITRLNSDFALPFIFGVLTTDNLQQASDRVGGKHGNKGVEAAITALKMLALADDLVADEEE